MSCLAHNVGMKVEVELSEKLIDHIRHRFGDEDIDLGWAVEFILNEDAANTMVFVTSKEAAEILKLSRSRIHQLREEGKLPAVRNSAGWMYSLADVNALITK